MRARTHLASMVLSVTAVFFAPSIGAETTDGVTLLPTTDLVPKVDFHGEVGSETLQYPTPIEGRPELGQNHLLRATLKIKKETETYAAISEVQAAKSLNLNNQYLAIQQLYAGAPDHQGFFLGRKIEFWNQADQEWNLGLWQPLYQDDSLRPIPQGLMGAFYKYETNRFQALVFATPVFIPTMMPDLIEKNGTLLSDSRWVRPFPSQVNVNGSTTALTYRLDIPNAVELATQSAAAARVQIGDRSQGPWGAVAYAKKPINALSIKYDAAILSGGSSATGQASVSPVVHRHDLLSVDFGWTWENSRLGASYIQDTPEKQAVKNITDAQGFTTDYYQQQPEPLQAYSLRFSQRDQIPWMEKEIQWTASYLRAFTRATKEYDIQGIERSQFIPHRLLFTHAISLQSTVLLTQAWQAKVKYLRDFDQRGSLWNFEGQYRPGKEWAFHFGLDALGVDDQKAQENDTTFLNYYRQNDRVYGGFAYVF